MNINFVNASNMEDVMAHFGGVDENNRALELTKLGRYAEAEQIYRNILKFQEKILNIRI